jgi:TolB protein
MKMKARFSVGLIILILLVLVLLNLSAFKWLGWPVPTNRAATGQPQPSDSALLPSQTTSPLPAATLTATPSQTPYPPTLTPIPIHPGAANPAEALNTQGLLIASIQDGAWAHLFAYHPGLLPLTRLSSSQWDEIDPAISPDGTKLAYASRQNGYWDLYIRDLSSGTVRRVTDTPDYEGRPSWSPDGLWLICESYRADNLDLFLISASDPSQPAIRLTEDAAPDSSPSWSPQGRKIAFISNRTGTPAVWIADLDRTDAARFQALLPYHRPSASSPAWSKDGRRLAWTEAKTGSRRLVNWDSQNPDIPPVEIAVGDQLTWTPDNRYLIADLEGPNQSNLETIEAATGAQSAALMAVPGKVYGLTWKPGPLTGWLSEMITRADRSTPAPLTAATLTVAPNLPAGRTAMISIPDVSAPVPLLSDQVDEPFASLRLEAARLSGWDVLSSLENAYIPLTTPNDPSIRDEWLYTGRAFSLNPLILSAGWMAIIREDYNGQTYWRVYLKARFQDGSAGRPMTHPVWDINARFAGDPSSYEQGGQPGEVLPGYWIDLTEVSQRYGWERLPSHTNWRTFFPAVRFNQFVYRQGLDWDAAMREVYPPEAMATPTSIPTPTNTPTTTREPTRTATIFVPSATPTLTPTRRPTLTQVK